MGAGSCVRRDLATDWLIRLLGRLRWGLSGRCVRVAFRRMESGGWDKQHRTGGGERMDSHI